MIFKLLLYRLVDKPKHERITDKDWSLNKEKKSQSKEAKWK